MQTPSEQEFVNTAVLGSSGASEDKSTVLVRSIFSCHTSNGGSACYEGDESESTPRDDVLCEAASDDGGASDAVLETAYTTGGCAVRVRADAAFGGDVAVNVSHADGFHGVARFRVWHPYVAGVVFSRA